MGREAASGEAASGQPAAYPFPGCCPPPSHAPPRLTAAPGSCLGLRLPGPPRAPAGGAGCRTQPGLASRTPASRAPGGCFFSSIQTEDLAPKQRARTTSGTRGDPFPAPHGPARVQCGGLPRPRGLTDTPTGVRPVPLKRGLLGTGQTAGPNGPAPRLRRGLRPAVQAWRFGAV